MVTYEGTEYTGTLAASSSTTGKMYLVHHGGSGKNIYDEYITVGEYSWEMIGTTQVDLTGYVAVTEQSFTTSQMSDKAMFYAVMMIWDTYYTFNKPEWVSQENQEYRDITERKFAAYFRKHKSKWETMPMQDKMAISNGVRQRSVAEGMLVEAVTIPDWLKKVEEM